MTTNNLLYLFLIFALIGSTFSNPSFIPFTPEEEHNLVEKYGQVFKPTNQLRSSYLTGSKNKAHHRADVVFDTKIPSLNPDQTGAVKSIECGTDGNITLTIKDDNYLKMVENWPKGNLMLLISHQWECFGKQTTQFFLAGNKTIDAQKLQVEFTTTEPCEVMKWSNSFSLDMIWEKPTNPKENFSNLKSKSKLKRRGRLAEALADKSTIDIDKSNTIDLNILYDEETGKSSKPNIPLIKIGQNIAKNGTGLDESLLCQNCFVKGQATISLHIEGHSLPTPEITNATISMDGDLNFNFDLKVNNGIGVAPSTPDIQIAELPLSPLGVPGLFNIGPSIILAASAKVSTAVTGTLYTGGSISYPQFHMSASLLDSQKPNFQQFGFDAKTTPKEPTVGVTVSGGVSGSLKPQLALSVDVMNGLLQAKTGFQVITTLGADITVGAESGCSNLKQPHIETALSGGLGFFVQSVNLPTFSFPKKVIGEKCV
ncbi:hypothetical protein G9A89_004151 [Geosiphon pyriformis]|nr:hypothetical protein G9A89_004151 [Geosiphon pyriformis]